MEPEQEQELIDGFLSRKPAAETKLVVELQRRMRVHVAKYSPRIWREMADLQQSGLLRLCEMRENPEEVALIQPPIWELVRFLLVAPSRKAQRAKPWVRLKRKHDRLVTSKPNQVEALELKELAEIAESLPRGMARTMLAQEALMAGDGPPLDEALGIDARSARRRLARAQDAVMAIALGENVEIEKEDEDE